MGQQKQNSGKTTLAIVLVIFLATIFSSAQTIQGFHSFIDSNLDRYTHSFRQGDKEYLIGKVRIDGPYYDGDEGNTAIYLREKEKNKQHSVKDLYTELLSGQYYLAGFDSTTSKIYAFKTSQLGCVSKIVAIVCVDIGKAEIETTSLDKAYQYGFVSPDGKLFVMLEKSLDLFRMSDKSTKTLKEQIEIPASNTSTNGSDLNQLEGGAFSAIDNIAIEWTSNEDFVLKSTKEGTAEAIIFSSLNSELVSRN